VIQKASDDFRALCFHGKTEGLGEKPNSAPLPILQVIRASPGIESRKAWWDESDLAAQ
jgi:hypothetical protein